MNEQYYYTGKYREFRGYVFANGHPVTITDRGTLEALKKDATFKLVEKEERQAPITVEVLEPKCDKCGRIIVRGMYMHKKFCKGIE